VNRAEIKQIVELWAAAVAAADLEALSNLVADDVRDTSAPTLSIGRETFRLRASAVGAAFGEMDVRVDDLVIENDRAAWRWTLSGIHKGAFAGLAATGRRVSFRGINFQSFAAGKVVEHWTMVDAAALMKQLTSV
jgi:steroid delta-isomerase-like uncharacterized protein